MTAPVLDVELTTPTVAETVAAAVDVLGIDPAVARAAVEARRRAAVDLDLDRVGRIIRRGGRR